ncbi:MAG: hypothetical protein Q7U98_13115 [Methylicorpusculum sp.]|uniref:hypothetical protein n=1 Tax=Methylicorpusculum sp. TaxID=2713644 RepID=UPI002722E5B3|nr:hypothetical protein [Methylicorpusculum sp.]MDO8940092.1 hypothetical protein [Methylicorpusculum sp.]MDP2202520.1 hypothetical protein [Methylicorpusculum sp.]
MELSILDTEKQHLAELLEAIQRCVYFLDTSSKKITWPLTADLLETQKKDVVLFEAMAAINERFAKLQDTIGAAMGHACILAGESTDSFLKVLSFYEKIGVLESVESWRLCRTARNLAAHDYDIEYAEIADHFNALKKLTPLLYMCAARFLGSCQEELSISPKQADFTTEFMLIVKTKQADESGIPQ